MEYEDFELQIGPRSREGLVVRVLRSPAGEGEALARIPGNPGYPEPLAGAARHLVGEACGLTGSPAEVGGDLFRSVFTGQIAALLQRSLSRLEPPLRGLRVRVRINPRDRTLASLQRLPWELLYREDTEDFLALSRCTPVVRVLDVPRPTALRPYEPPLRILAILARDPESSPLSLEEELKELRKALDRNPAIHLEILEDPDTRAIRSALDKGAFHILHYMGHGIFEQGSGEGALLFGSPAGRLPVTGRHLATKVKDLDTLRLVVLNACETAVAGGEAAQEPFAGIATALVLGGIPAVVAMQSAIGDTHAVAFTSAFYERLAAGMSIEEAVTEGRQAIHSLEPDQSSWAIPVLFLRAAAADLFTSANLLSAEPPRRGRVMRRLPGVVVAFLLLGIAAVGVVDRWSQQTPGGSAPGVTTRLSGAPDKSLSAEPESKEQTTSSREHVRPEIPASAPAPRSPSASTTSEETTVRFQITGDAPRGLSMALRQEAQPLSRALSGRIVHVNAESALESFNEGAIPMRSCRIMASASLQKGKTSIDLGPVSVAGAQIDDYSACEEAARKLARAVVQKLARYLQEDSR